MKRSIDSLLREFPPCLCRMLAKHGHCAPSNRDLATRSHLTRDRINDISLLTTWDTVTVGEMQEFMRLCGVDPTNARRHRDTIRRKRWSHWNRAHSEGYLIQLMRRLYASRDTQTNRT